MVNIDEAKEYLGVDFDDTDKTISRLIRVADTWLKGAIGDDYPQSDERAKQLALFVIEDMYDRKSYNVKENATLEKLKNDFIKQLQYEPRQPNGKL